LLSARAALRTGTGLLTCHVPECGYDIMQSGIPEAMCETDAQPAFISSVSELRRFNAAGIGPGIGQHEAAETAVANFLRAVNYPVVIDADALNLLSRHPEWYELIPKGSILTPHPKEFGRLFGKSSSGYEQWEKLRRWSAEHQLLIILKGGRTVVADYTKPYLTFNTSGNPGMATGGSGDVLTGVITGLLAQGYEPGDAARFGVYLHGLAGDLAAAENSQESMLAGDIVRHLGKAYLFLGES
jgi:NAD(P)H-hydrate epimerase